MKSKIRLLAFLLLSVQALRADVPYLIARPATAPVPAKPVAAKPAAAKPAPPRRIVSPDPEIQAYIDSQNTPAARLRRLQAQQREAEARRQEQLLWEMRRQNDELQRLRQAIYSHQQYRNQ